MKHIIAFISGSSLSGILVEIGKHVTSQQLADLANICAIVVAFLTFCSMMLHFVQFLIRLFKSKKQEAINKQK